VGRQSRRSTAVRGLAKQGLLGSVTFQIVTPAKAGVQGKRRSGSPGFLLSRE